MVKPGYKFQKEAGRFLRWKGRGAKSKVKGKERNGCEHQKTFV